MRHAVLAAINAQETGLPGPGCRFFVGGIVIFAGNYLNIWVETRRKVS